MTAKSDNSIPLRNRGSVTPSLPIRDDKQNDKSVSTDPDLQQVIDARADLPEVVKTGILAMVEASQAKM